MNTRVLERGVAAGLIGATVVAIIFLFLDLIAGTPFRTPGIMAGMLLGTEGAAGVPAYTILHYMSFLVVGVASAWALDLLRVKAPILVGLALGGMLFALLFYGSALFTGPSVVNAVGWPAIWFANTLAGLAIVFTIRRMSGNRKTLWVEEVWHDPCLREGVYMGLSAAVAVAIWLLLVDLVQGRPLFTPAALGSALLLDAGDVSGVVVNAATVLGYTFFHGVGFIVLGILVATAARAAETTPSLLVGAMLLFFVFEAFFIGVVTLFGEFILGATAWWAIMGGNLVAALWMAAWVSRRHPILIAHLRRSEFSSEEGEREHSNPAPMPR